ncbi:unnamed protein product [Amoebophrya sp. A25]|nr:unnamed protein product [Amoebophrya sp. A25]|eukprot:GSA25T00000677001.1
MKSFLAVSRILATHVLLYAAEVLSNPPPPTGSDFVYNEFLRVTHLPCWTEGFTHEMCCSGRMDPRLCGLQSYKDMSETAMETFSKYVLTEAECCGTGFAMRAPYDLTPPENTKWTSTNNEKTGGVYLPQMHAATPQGNQEQMSGAEQAEDTESEVSAEQVDETSSCPAWHSWDVSRHPALQPAQINWEKGFEYASPYWGWDGRNNSRILMDDAAKGELEPGSTSSSVSNEEDSAHLHFRMYKAQGVAFLPGLYSARYMDLWDAEQTTVKEIMSKVADLRKGEKSRSAVAETASRPYPNLCTFLDLGGNLGGAAITLAKRFPELRVISLEPNPLFCRFLMWNIKRNNLLDRVWPLCVGLAVEKDVLRAGASTQEENTPGAEAEVGIKAEEQKTLADTTTPVRRRFTPKCMDNLHAHACSKQTHRTFSEETRNEIGKPQDSVPIVEWTGEMLFRALGMLTTTTTTTEPDISRMSHITSESEAKAFSAFDLVKIDCEGCEWETLVAAAVHNWSMLKEEQDYDTPSPELLGSVKSRSGTTTSSGAIASTTRTGRGNSFFAENILGRSVIMGELHFHFAPQNSDLLDVTSFRRDTCRAPRLSSLEFIGLNEMRSLLLKCGF